MSSTPTPSTMAASRELDLVRINRWSLKFGKSRGWDWVTSSNRAAIIAEIIAGDGDQDQDQAESIADMLIEMYRPRPEAGSQ